MSLLGLPPELIEVIIGYTLPNGLENLVLSCKTIHAIGKSHIQEHVQYQRRWRRFAFTESVPGRPDVKTVMELLLEISRDPVVAHYIESTSLWARGLSTEAEETRSRAITEDEEKMTSIGRLIRQSRYPEVAHQDPDVWLRHIAILDHEDFSSSNHAMVVLLTLLPNVKSLELPFAWVDLRVLRTQQARSAANAREGLEPLGVLETTVALASTPHFENAALRKLKCIPPHAYMSYDQRNSLEEVLPFMALDSLKELYTCNMVAVNDGYTGIPFEWRYRDRNSNLRKVEIVSGCIDGNGITGLVKHTPHLTTLRYSHHTKWHGCLHDWNAGEFVAAIARHRSDTLKELAVTIDCLFGEVEQSLISLQGFEHLETAEFDVQVFNAPPYGADEGLGQSVADVQALKTVLPPTMKRLHLFDSFGGEDNADNTLLLHKLLDTDGQHENPLSELLEFSVRSERGIITHAELQALPAEGERRLNALAWLCRDKLRAGFSGNMPYWKESFHERFGSLRE